MGYTPQVWNDGPGGGTPLTAARMNYVETGVSEALHPVLVADLTYPFVIAHRGEAGVAPENTLEAFEIAHAHGIDAIEGGDVRLTKDGGLVVMHDSTIDRTTTGTGNVSDQSTMNWRRLAIDSVGSFGLDWGSTLHPPFFTDILAGMGGKVILTPEAKVDAAVPMMIDLISDAGLQKSVIMQCGNSSLLSSIAAAGIPAGFVDPTGVALSASALAATGASYLICDVTNVNVTAGLITSMHAAGIKVIGFTPNRQVDVATFIGTKGGDAVFSDEPLYGFGAYNSYRYLVQADPFGTQTFYHGHLPSNANDRGQYTAPADWGFTNSTATGYRGALQGWGSPVGGATVPTSYTITLQVVIDAVNAGDTSRWASVMFAAPTDLQWSDTATTQTGVNGYHLLFRANGQLNLYRIDNGVGTLLVQKTTGITPVSLGATVVGLNVQVTPAGITANRTDIAYSVTIADTTYRGGYWHLGRSGAAVRFRNVTVT